MSVSRHLADVCIGDSRKSLPLRTSHAGTAPPATNFSLRSTFSRRRDQKRTMITSALRGTTSARAITPSVYTSADFAAYSRSFVCPHLQYRLFTPPSRFLPSSGSWSNRTGGNRWIGAGSGEGDVGFRTSMKSQRWWRLIDPPASRISRARLAQKVCCTERASSDCLEQHTRPVRRGGDSAGP
jgi:hypothetical protein